MSEFNKTLDDKATQIRKLAAGREFENELYEVAWTKSQSADYANDGWGPEAYCRNGQLSLKRYLDGGSQTTDNNSTYYVQPGSEAWNYKFDTTEWVNELFATFGQGHPKKLDVLLEKIASVPPKLCGDPDWVKGDALDRTYGEGSAKAEDGKSQYGIDSITDSVLFFGDGITQIAEWDGDAAGTFVEGVGANGDKWRGIAWRSYVLGEALRAAVESQAAINASARTDILELADVAAAVMLEVRDAFIGAEDAPKLTIGGAIVSTGLSLAKLAKTGSLWGAAVSITGGLLGLMDTSKPVAGKKTESGIKITGDTPAAVLDSLQSGVEELKAMVSKEEDKIAGQLEDIYEGVVGSMKKYKLLFEDDTYDKEFPDNAKDAKSLGERRFTVNPTMLKDAAKDSFPPAVEAILGANKTLATTAGDEEGAFASDHAIATSPIAPRWMELRDLLQDLTAENGEKVENAGQVILHAAIEYADLDDKNAKKIEKTYDEHEPVTSGRDHKETVERR